MKALTQHVEIKKYNIPKPFEVMWSNMLKLNKIYNTSNLKFSPNNLSYLSEEKGILKHFKNVNTVKWYTICHMTTMMKKWPQNDVQIKYTYTHNHCTIHIKSHIIIHSLYHGEIIPTPPTLTFHQAEQSSAIRTCAHQSTTLTLQNAACFHQSYSPTKSYVINRDRVNYKLSKTEFFIPSFDCSL